MKHFLKFLLPCLTLALLSSGCATNTNMRASAPTSEAPTESSSKLLMRSTGMPMNVEYSVGPSDLPCKELEPVGTMRDKGKNFLLPRIVKLTEKLSRVPEQIETLVPGEQAVQVSGHGRWFDSNFKGRCGSVIVSFLPAEKHTYLVEFVWQGTSQCAS